MKLTMIFSFLISVLLTSCNPKASPLSMNNTRLEQHFRKSVQNLKGEAGRWQFSYQGGDMLCFTDETHDRMRIIAIIMETKNLTDEQLHQCMEANFDRSLDVRYCFYQGRLWTAFIHPLSELTERFLDSSLSQVAASHKNFGDSYSSGALSFHPNRPKEK
jgi:hypothetical protein